MTKTDSGIEQLDGLEGRRLALFEDRYGPGSHERLLALLRRPCVPFARIAARFQVTRERVRQWHAVWLPDAPTGRERRRLCAVQQQQRRLLGDALFAAFVRDVRRDAGGLRVEPVAASSGYRTRLAKLGGRVVALRDARQTARRSSLDEPISYRIVGYRGRAEFVYVLLTENEYLCVPVAELPLHGATFVDHDPSRLRVFKNAFDALLGAVSAPSVRAARSNLTREENTADLVGVKES
jgi:hypothetical protein